MEDRPVKRLQTTIRSCALATLAVLGARAGCCREHLVDSAADTAGVAAASIAWKQTFNAGDPAAVTALYAEDAVLSAPGKPVVRGRAAIGEYFVKTAASSPQGLTLRTRQRVRRSPPVTWATSGRPIRYPIALACRLARASC